MFGGSLSADDADDADVRRCQDGLICHHTCRRGAGDKGAKPSRLRRPAAERRHLCSPQREPWVSGHKPAFSRGAAIFRMRVEGGVRDAAAPRLDTGLIAIPQLMLLAT